MPDTFVPPPVTMIVIDYPAEVVDALRRIRAQIHCLHCGENVSDEFWRDDHSCFEPTPPLPRKRWADGPWIITDPLRETKALI